MNYRPYQPADFPHLYAIEEVCFQPPLRFSRRYLRRIVASADSIAWIAEEDAIIAGFAVADFGQDTGGRFAYIETIEVRPGMRRRGAGNELLRRIEESARDHGARSIWLHVESQNAGAIRLYESHGYACQGRKENYYARGQAGLIYRKLLSEAVTS